MRLKLARQGLVAFAGVTMLLVPVVAGAATSHLDFRIYDPAHVVKTQITVTGVVRSSAKAMRDPATGRGILLFQLTKQGNHQLRVLTRALARRGALLHRDLPVVIEIDGRLQTDFIGYEVTPDGINAAGTGIEMTGLKLATARRLAALIRQG